MNHFLKNLRAPLLALSVLVLHACSAPGHAMDEATGGEATGGGQDDPKMTFKDIMQFNHIDSPVISYEGDLVVFALSKDRGDGEVRVNDTGGTTLHTIERGSSPSVTRNSRWVGAYVHPPAEQVLRPGAESQRRGFALLDVDSGDKEAFEEVRNYSFSNDSQWALIHHHHDEDIQDEQTNRGEYGSRLILRHLESGEQTRIPFVESFSVDSTASHLVYTVADTSGEENGIYYRELSDEQPEQQMIHEQADGHYSSLSWHNDSGRLAFIASQRDEDEQTGPADIMVWNSGSGNLETLLTSADAPDGWLIPSHSGLQWTNDGDRLFFGFQPERMHRLARKDFEHEVPEEEFDLYDYDQILEGREVDVWHPDDDRIKTHEKRSWQSVRDRTYRSVYHFHRGEYVKLADRDVPSVYTTENDAYTLARTQEPYMKQRTWDGSYYDYYVVDLNTGERERFIEELRSNYQVDFSPGGRFAVYYHEKDWHLYDVQTGSVRNLTEDIDVPFHDVDADRVYTAPGHGTGGWVNGDEAVLIYDKFDIWQFDTATGQAQNITGGQGRETAMQYRVRDMDPQTDTFDHGQELFLSGFNDREKYYGFYAGQIGGSGVQTRIEGDYRYRLAGRAESSDELLFRRERFDEFPNLWVADDHHFSNDRRVSDANPQMKEFAWGEAELVEWLDVDGDKTQGVLIKPANYEEDKRYPVLTYFYARYSGRLHHFDDHVINHRPNLSLYANHGYAIFLPDIWFDIGTPGYSATKSLVPGIQKLIEMGVADPDAIGLHGHSWSGYQTAHVITQTDIFDAAVAGAPVSNMTSAYGGIRWGTGLSRQFQYEKTQSRLGVSLWENREPYIENSPLFYADRMNTPLLSWFGDVDTAVPWEQGIELYMATRRLGKDHIFLQYRDEPHHLTEYPNKLDYMVRMKEFFEHHLRGEPAPEWIEEGEPYLGN